MVDILENRDFDHCKIKQLNCSGFSAKYGFKHLQTTAGVKKSLVLEPGTSKISGRTSIYFSQCPGDK